MIKIVRINRPSCILVWLKGMVFNLMTAKQKRNREAAVENMYYLYKKYYPIREEKLIKASEEKDKRT